MLTKTSIFFLQGHGRALWLMYGFYKANGGCGYVKKPDFLMQTCPDGKVFDPKADLPVKATLKVDGMFLSSFPLSLGFRSGLILYWFICRSRYTWAKVGTRTSSRRTSTHTHLQIST